MNKSVLRFILILVLTLCSVGGFSQEAAMKTNILYWGTGSLNLGAEFSLAEKSTLEIAGGYNPWDWTESKKMKHWMVQPEVRYWLCEKFNGHFFGLHGLLAEYNFGGLPVFNMRDYRYEGWIYGGGLSYGYQKILSNRWSLEFTLGVGFLHLKQTKYTCSECPEIMGDSQKNYIGPTKAGISLIYIIK